MDPLSHARSEEKLEDHLELLRCHYNFVRPHGALKFGRETRTPAMQAGLATRRLTFREVFVCLPPSLISRHRPSLISPNRKIFEARKRETAALGAGEKLVLGHPLAATIGDSARCMQNLEKVLFTGPKTSDTVTFICD